MGGSGSVKKRANRSIWSIASLDVTLYHHAKNMGISHPPWMTPAIRNPAWVSVCCNIAPVCTSRQGYAYSGSSYMLEWATCGIFMWNLSWQESWGINPMTARSVYLWLTLHGLHVMMSYQILFIICEALMAIYLVNLPNCGLFTQRAYNVKLQCIFGDWAIT